MSPGTAGAILLLGCSMGGELFNPGAVELVTLADLTDKAPTELVPQMARSNLIGCSVALVAFWALAVRRERREGQTATEPAADEPTDAEPFRVNLIKAAVPLVPLALLFAAPDFLTLPDAFAEFEGPATILTAMLIGVAAAGATSPHQAGKLSTAFFEGAGFAYTRVISLIVTATLFAEGIKATGLIDRMTARLARLPALAMLLGMALPWSLAWLTGSGIAPAVAVMKAIVPEAASVRIDPIRLGAMTSMAAHYGRTMSPAAAVVMMSATLSQADAVSLLRRVTPPLLLGGLVLFLAGLLGLN